MCHASFNTHKKSIFSAPTFFQGFLQTEPAQTTSTPHQENMCTLVIRPYDCKQHGDDSTTERCARVKKKAGDDVDDEEVMTRLVQKCKYKKIALWKVTPVCEECRAKREEKEAEKAKKLADKVKRKANKEKGKGKGKGKEEGRKGGTLVGGKHDSGTSSATSGTGDT